ncbi:MAG: hypothetical protein HN976_28525 [Lentisphaerae bacterium]|nr:hypothetical protein [Lentisphaerota bacterium]MBT7059075.1 hypothetical protein [Lentisphaerota bacterium]
MSNDPRDLVRNHRGRLDGTPNRGGERGLLVVCALRETDSDYVEPSEAWDWTLRRYDCSSRVSEWERSLVFP